MPDLAPGTQIASRYTVERTLGRGAMKEVYLARDEHTGMRVAVALLTDTMRRDATVSARFSREGRAAAALRSPYTVRVYEVGKLADGTRYLVTEAVIGRDLGDALENGPVDPLLAARWTAQVLAALSEAHARGVLHRDVKPENVLLAPGPHGETAKLADFGLAKILDLSLEGSVMLRTAQNALLGTPDYMPPEQWQALALDGRADVYATGAMLYELLSGRAPFRGKALHEFCVAHVTSPVPPLPEGLPALAYALEPVVRRAMEKQPSARYPSADAMRAELEATAGILVDPDTLVRPGDSLAPPPPPPPHPVAGSSPTLSPAQILRGPRVELVCDAWPGVVQLVRGNALVLGRESDGDVDVALRCLPPSDEAHARTRALSRRHARLAWDPHQQRGTIEDLGSRAGTFLLGMPVTGRPMGLRSGDEVSFGKHVRARYECDPSPDAAGVRWMKLSRTDPMGAEQVHLLVLREAKVSSGADAALRAPASLAAGDVLRVVPHADGFGVLMLGAPEPVPMTDGQTLRVGGLRISVAIDG